MAKKESKSKTKTKSNTNKRNKKSSNKGSRGSNNAEELKMIKSPLTEAFNNRELIVKSAGNTIRNFLILNVIMRYKTLSWIILNHINKNIKFSSKFGYIRLFN